MPVLDWTRTDLDFKLDDGSTALRFSKIEFSVFHLFLLKRNNADKDYTSKEISLAKELESKMIVSEKKLLVKNIIAGLPGAEEGYTLDNFNTILETYKNIGEEELRNNLFFFKQIIPIVEQSNVLMCIHPDDPPFSLLGLPRIVSNEKDILKIYNAVDSVHNGLTFCTGSFGVRQDNNLPEMVKNLGARIHFIHLRST